jgi:hypothetical protein
MAENMVGETGFEPATLCSQSQREARDRAGLSVKRRDFLARCSAGLRAPCKISALPLASSFLAEIDRLSLRIPTGMVGEV